MHGEYFLSRIGKFTAAGLRGTTMFLSTPDYNRDCNNHFGVIIMTSDAIHLKNRYEITLKKIGIAAAFMAAGFLLGRIRILSALSPFGPAFIAACFLSKRPEMLLSAAGVVLGAMLLPDSALFIMAVVLVQCAALIAGYKRRRRWVAIAATVLAYGVGAAIFRMSDINTAMTAVLECLIALVMVYAFHTMLQIAAVRGKRTVFKTEETISLALGVLVVVCMLGPLSVGGVYIAHIIALLIVLSAAYIGGAALGAGVGLALGAACCLGISAEVQIIGMYGISGMAAGTLRRLKKPGTAMGFTLVNLLFILALYSSAVWYLALIEVGAAAALFMLLPVKLLRFAGRYFNAQTRREYEHRLHERRFRELTVGRLKEVSEVFMQTGRMFSDEAAGMVRQNAGISGALSIVAENACRDCVFKKSCWDKDFLSTYNVFGKLFASYEGSGRIDKRLIDSGFAKKCYHIDRIISIAESVFAAYLRDVKWQKKVEESRMITGRQLRGVASVVSDIGREMDTGFRFVESAEQDIAAALDAAGIHAGEVCAEKTTAGGLSIGLRVGHAAVSDNGRRCMEKAVSRACGVRMRIAGSAAGQAGSILRFEQATRFDVLTGIAMAAKGEVSGDSHSFQGLRGGRYMLMLCDGMGSGENARKESAAAVSLIENFYQAGFRDSVIFDTINRLLMLKGSEDMFSTVDLCMLDLKSGAATFTKIGAECAYILGGGGIATIAPGSLPIGILDDLKPVSTKKMLRGGDMIVMMSDGVTDRMGEDGAAWLMDIPAGTAQEVADAILQKAMSDAPPADDMTVMVSEIVEC